MVKNQTIVEKITEIVKKRKKMTRYLMSLVLQDKLKKMNVKFDNQTQEVYYIITIYYIYQVQIRMKRLIILYQTNIGRPNIKKENLI